MSTADLRKRGVSLLRHFAQGESHNWTSYLGRTTLRHASRLSVCRREHLQRGPLLLGHGNRPVSWHFHGWKDCYLAFNDPYGEILHNVFTLTRAGFLEVDRFVSVVGSLTALHLLVALTPRVIHFFDMNPCAVVWGKMLLEVISVATTPQEFISRIFARDVASFEEKRGKLSHVNQAEFLAQPVSEVWQRSTQALLGRESRETYCSVLVPFQRGEQRFGWNTPSILPCEDRRRFRTYTRTGLGPQGRLPSDGFASFLYGEGWLSSPWTFEEVRRKLDATPIFWAAPVDFPCASVEEVLCGVGRGDRVAGERVVIYVMDMFSSGFAAFWPLSQAARYRGDGRLVVLQSITARKDELVLELVGARDGAPRWRSLSVWDSSMLLPPHVCQIGEGQRPGCRGEGVDVSRALEETAARAVWTAHPRLIEELARFPS